MIYENRVIAFIDILGFKNIVKDSIDKNGNDIEDKIEMIKNAFNAIRDVWDLNVPQKSFLKEVKADSKKINMFSDSIVISFRAEERSEIFYTLQEIQWMIGRLAKRGMFCRGVVEYGKLIHEDNMIFGPALINAYEQEHNAKFPRIIVGKEILDISEIAKAYWDRSSQEREYVEGLLEKDNDGVYFINYLKNAFGEFDDPETDFINYLNSIYSASKIILDNQGGVDPEVYKKYQWLKDKYNKCVSYCKKPSFLAAIRQNQGDIIYKKYAELLFF